MAISNLTPVEEWPTRKLPQDRFDAAVKTAMDQMSVMVGELNSAFIPQTNEAIDTINGISTDLPTILDSPNQAAAAAASAEKAKQEVVKAQAARTGAEAARTGAEAARDAAEAARDAAEAAGNVGIATTEKAGLVKPDGVSLKIKDAAGKMMVEDIAIGGNASDLASARGRFGKLVAAVGITSLRSIGVTCDLSFWAAEWGKVTDRPFDSAAGAIVSVRSNESSASSRGHILVRDLSTGGMWIAYWNENETSAFRKVITTTDIATRSTPGIVKVGGGLDVSGDGTLRYSGMSATTLSVGKNTRLNASSARNFVLTATVASPSVFLPNPSTLYAGEQFTFFAEGNNIRVRDFKGQAVGPVLARGKAYLFTLINKTTGEWARAEFSASGTSGDGGSLGFQPSISAPVIFSGVAEGYSTDIELETGRVLHFGSSLKSDITIGTLSLVSVTGWGAVSVKNTTLPLPQDFILHDLFKLSSSLCCVLAKDTKTNKKFAVIPVDVSGATAVVGEANILTTEGTLENPIFSRVDDAHALLVYGDGTSLYARLYSFSRSTVTAAAPVLVTSSVKSFDYLAVQRMDDTRWLLRTGNFVLLVLEVSGASITVGEPVTFTPDAAWTSCGFKAVSTAPGGNVLIYVSYSRQEGSTNQNVIALLVYTSSGLVLTEGTLTEIPDTYKSASFLNIDGHMFLWYYRGSSSYSYYLVPVTVDNGTATVGAECLIFTTSESFYNNLTLLTYTGDTYAIMSVYKARDSKRIYFLRGGFKIAPDGSLMESDPPGPATSISNITWGWNPCIQAFPGGRYVYSAGYAVEKNNSDGSTTTVGYTDVIVLNSSFTSLCSARMDDFVSKLYSSSWIFTSSPYLYPSVFPTGEAQALVILNQYDTRKPAWALFTL